MTPEQREELAACPFCGDTEGQTVEHVEGTIIHPAYFVKCDNCGAIGPTTDRGDHRESWNQRAQVEALTVPQERCDGCNGIHTQSCYCTEPQVDAGITASMVLAESPENAGKTAETRMDTKVGGAAQNVKSVDLRQTQDEGQVVDFIGIVRRSLSNSPEIEGIAQPSGNSSELACSSCGLTMEQSCALAGQGELLAIGRKMSNWLTSIALSMQFDSWRETCQELAAQWNDAAPTIPAIPGTKEDAT